MELKRPFLFCIKVVVDLIFLSVLLYWTSVAFYKYIAQPISTHTSYTIGDDGKYITFPHMSFCRVIPTELLHCRQSNEVDFVTLLKNCLQWDSTFDVDAYLENSTIRIIDFVYRAEMRLQSGLAGDDLRPYFYQKYHAKYGACVVFDGDAVKIPINSANEETALMMEFNSSALGFAYLNLISFHSRYDGSDAFIPTIRITTRYATNTAIKLKKKMISREPTDEFPCGEFSQEACQEVKGNQYIASALKCKVPFLYTGRFLSQYIDGDNDLPNCNHNTLAEALNIFMDAAQQCQQANPCKKTKITHMVEKQYVISNSPVNGLDVMFSDFEVEHDISSINYDLQSLICEVGGVLGMTLGFSGLSIGHAIVNFFKRL